jgi:hypothetical protein
VDVCVAAISPMERLGLAEILAELKAGRRPRRESETY